MKAVILLALAACADAHRLEHRLSVHSKHKSHAHMHQRSRQHLKMKQIPNDSDKKMFAQLDTEIEQTQKNTGQGVLGRQLGLTKVVSMKLHMHELEKNLKSQISNVENEVKDGDYIKMAQVQEKELTALQNEARNI